MYIKINYISLYDLFGIYKELVLYNIITKMNKQIDDKIDELIIQIDDIDEIDDPKLYSRDMKNIYRDLEQKRLRKELNIGAGRPRKSCNYTEATYIRKFN